MAQMTALRRRMIDDMTVRNLSPATQQSYVYAVAKFSRFFGCSPDRLGIEEVRAYQLHLAGQGAEEAAGGAQRRRDRALSAGYSRAAQAGGSDHSLWRGVAGVRG